MKVPKPKKLPSGSWNIYMRLGGEGISITRESKEECKLEAELIKAQYRNGIKAKRNKSAKNKTLEELMEDYINSRKKVLSPSTIRGYNTIKDNRFQAYINEKPSAIKNWQTVINKEVQEGVSAKTLKNSWGLLASSLEYAGLEIPDIKLPAIMPKTRPWLDADQIKTFIKAIHGDDCEIPALLALHSLRRSEIMGLSWDKVDLKKKTIRVEGSAVFDENNKLTHKDTNKSRKSRRTVPIMIPELEIALKAVPKEKRVGNIVKCNPNTIWARINRVCKANGLPEVGVHGLRHSFASLALSSAVGMTEREVMEIGGWEDQQTVHKIYEHLSAKSRLEAENKLTAFFKKADEIQDGTAKAQ